MRACGRRRADGLERLAGRDAQSDLQLAIVLGHSWIASAADGTGTRRILLPATPTRRGGHSETASYMPIEWYPEST